MAPPQACPERAKRVEWIVDSAFGVARNDGFGVMNDSEVIMSRPQSAAFADDCQCRFPVADDCRCVSPLLLSLSLTLDPAAAAGEWTFVGHGDGDGDGDGHGPIRFSLPQSSLSP